jgi:hypothetical protein
MLVLFSEQRHPAPLTVFAGRSNTQKLDIVTLVYAPAHLGYSPITLATNCSGASRLYRWFQRACFCRR